MNIVRAFHDMTPFPAFLRIFDPRGLLEAEGQPVIRGSPKGKYIQQIYKKSYKELYKINIKVT